jgi:DNA-binding transcriptional LysR family regulator
MTGSSNMPDLALDLRYLRFALAAAEFGSFRRAALMLSVPQSTISRRVQALEDRLGVAIFDRRYSGVVLTPAGAQFLQDAKFSMEQLTIAVASVDRFRSGKDGVLQIGIFTSLSSGFLRDLLQRFATTHPGVEVRLSSGAPEQLTAKLLSGALDVIFVTGDGRLAGCDTARLWYEEVLVALPEMHSLSDRQTLAWSDLRDERFIVSVGGPGPEIADYLVKYLGGLGQRPAIQSHDVGRDDLMHMVSIGYGITLTSQSTLGTQFPGVTLRRLSDVGGPLPWRAVWKRKSRNPALKRLVDLMTARRGEIDDDVSRHEAE